MSHTCSRAGGPWLIYKSCIFGWVAEWHKSVSKWLPPSSWLRGHDTRMEEPLIHSQKNGLKPIIGFNNDTIQSCMLWEQCCKSWRRPDDLKYLIILCLLGQWRRWSKWWSKGAREWWEWWWLIRPQKDTPSPSLPAAYPFVFRVSHLLSAFLTGSILFCP